jgi:hypothetical protein
MDWLTFTLMLIEALRWPVTVLAVVIILKVTFRKRRD